MSKLTAVQQQFVNTIFGPANGNITEAAKLLGFEDYTVLMTEDFIEAIKKRADQQIAMNVPRAVYVLNKMLTDEGGMFVNDKLAKVAADILDRAGISKQDRPSAQGATIGLVFLPDKKKLEAPPDEENEPQLQIEQPQTLPAN